jgi:hypothetical protein
MSSKYINWGLWRIVAAVVVFFGVSFFTGMGSDYTITRYRQDVVINQDGWGHVTKTISYKFDGSHRGISLHERAGSDSDFVTSNIDDLEVKVNGGSWQSPEEVEWLQDDSKDLEVKVYQTLNPGDKLQVRYWYDITGIAKRWQDTSEINWLLADKWAVPLNNVKVTVELPERAGHIQAFGHTEFGNQSHVDVSGRKISLTSQQVKADGRLELHALFNTKALTGADVKKKDGNRLAKAEQVERNVTLSNRLRLGFSWLVLGLLVVSLIVVLVYSFRGLRRRIEAEAIVSDAKIRAGVNQPVVHFFDTPTEAGPAVGYIRQNRISSYPGEDAEGAVRLWYATIVDLIARHYIELDVADQKHFTFKRTDKVDGLVKYEQRALDMLFVDGEREVSNDAFSDRESAVSRSLQENQSSFSQSAVSTAKLPDMLDRTLTRQVHKLRSFKMHKLAKMVVWMSLLAGGAAILLGLTSNWLLFLTILVPIFALMIYVGQLVAPEEVLTEDAYAEIYHWQGFESMLEDISNLNRSDLPDVVLWDRLFAFAVVYDIVEEVSKSLPKLMDQTELTNSTLLSSNNMVDAFVTYSIFDSLFDGDGIFAPEESHGSGSDSGSFFDGGSGFDGFSGGDGGSGGDAF